MKVAICICGQIRSLSLYFHTLINNIVKVIENDGHEVGIFIDSFNITKDYYNKNFSTNLYTTKMEIDRLGWENVLNKYNKYIKYKNIYSFSDQNIYDIFKKYTKYNPDDMKKYQNLKKSLGKNRSWKLIINAICMHYNNKVVINKVPEDYDIIIRLRGEGEYMSKFPKEIINKFKNNVIYFCNQNPTIIFTNQLGDNFFMGNYYSMNKIYKDLFSLFNTILEKYMKTGYLTGEMILEDLVNYNKMIPKTFIMKWKINRFLIHSKYK